MTYDFAIVGAGLAGSIHAGRLASQAGKTVLLLDKLPHISGNAYDCLNQDGMLIHQYGPHIFYTNSLSTAYFTLFAFRSGYTRLGVLSSITLNKR